MRHLGHSVERVSEDGERLTYVHFRLNSKLFFAVTKAALVVQNCAAVSIGRDHIFAVPDPQLLILSFHYYAKPSSWDMERVCVSTERELRSLEKSCDTSQLAPVTNEEPAKLNRDVALRAV
jgi:hypothetical protein